MFFFFYFSKSHHFRFLILIILLGLLQNYIMISVISVGIRTENKIPSFYTLHSLTCPCMNLNKHIKYLCSGYPHSGLKCLLCMRTAMLLYVYTALLRKTSKHTLKDRCAMKPADLGMLIDHRDVCDCLGPDPLTAQCISIWLS